MGIIKSILDTDLYKFSMSYAYLTLYPRAWGEFEFTDRDNTEYTEEFLQDLKLEIASLCQIRLSEEEKNWAILNIPYIPQSYWEWLSSYKFDLAHISVRLDENKHLHITARDLIYRSTLWEVPILAIVSECKSRMHGYTYSFKDVMINLNKKINLAEQAQLYFSEFGTRRRFSLAHQEEIISRLAEAAQPWCTGTSNVYFAMKYNMKPIGTMAHEYIMFHGAQFGYRMANYLALDSWSRVYDGDLGIALTDTYTSGAFFKNFSKKQAKLFDGIRHDSGDPFKYTMMAIERYKELGIDPKSKTIIFSNALTMPGFQEIAEYCRGRIKAAAGIGTNLTNDTGNKPSNIVMKLSKCAMTIEQPMRDCIKVSDDLGKHMGLEEEFDICCKELGI